MSAALALPRVLNKLADGPVMITGAWSMVAAQLDIAGAIMAPSG